MLSDAFICHAREDKDDFVRPLAERLREQHIEVWYDEFSLSVGDSLRRSIDRGLSQSRFGIVVLSHSGSSNLTTQDERNLKAGWVDDRRGRPSSRHVVLRYYRGGNEAVWLGLARRWR